MNRLSFSSYEFDILKAWCREALKEPGTGSDEYEEALNSLSEKILFTES